MEQLFIRCWIGCPPAPAYFACQALARPSLTLWFYEDNLEDTCNCWTRILDGFKEEVLEEWPCRHAAGAGGSGVESGDRLPATLVLNTAYTR